MENAVNHASRVEIKRVHSTTWLTNWKFIVGGIVIVIALVFAGISYYQATRFNANVMINGVSVGGLTADQTLKKLESTIDKNTVYVGQEQILDDKDTKMGFTDQDLPAVRKVLSNQRTLFPSSMVKTYSLSPAKPDLNQSETMKKLLEEKLTTMNKNLPAPQDAQAILEQSKIIVTKSINGKQYDVASIAKEYQNQEYNSEIHLNPVYIQPVKADSPIVKVEKQTLQNFLQRTVDYTVSDKVLPLKASDLIKNAAVTKDMQVTFDTGDITTKVNEINNTQSTLNKNFSFKTHTGAVVTVKGQSYGWAINVPEEAKRISEAFQKGEKSLSASNIYGVGYNTAGVGYHTTTNNGIGDTYAEVSIAEQRAYFYKNGQLMLSTNVVTGRHDVGEDTPTGVWYIMYKQTPSILRGSEVGMVKYAIKVNYWAQFTDDGVGFHDASWRTNWASKAYLTQGSGGCVNTPPSVMQSVYNNLTQNEPVIVY